MHDGVSIREFARQVGIDEKLIRRMVKQGRIPQNKDGTIPMKKGLDAFDRYKAAPKNKGGRPPKTKSKKTEKEDKKDDSVKITDAGLGTNADRAKETATISTAMSKAKLAEKTYQARLRELEYKVKSGELLEKTAVASEAAWLATQVKAKLLAIPPRIASMCEGRMAIEIDEIITDAINNALKELQKCEYTRENE